MICSTVTDTHLLHLTVALIYAKSSFVLLCVQAHYCELVYNAFGPNAFVLQMDAVSYVLRFPCLVSYVLRLDVVWHIIVIFCVTWNSGNQDKLKSNGMTC